MSWQPIASVPDDMRVLLYSAKVGVWIGRASLPMWHESIARRVAPTHWMPLPLAPTGEDEGE